jgi:mRNA-degrading endonuclease RelE of RelBE toxin-antitoxin system
MKSATLPSFWERYNKLDHEIRGRAKKAYRLWTENPFHPSLRFKCINHGENIWSVRVTLGYRALGVLDQDTVTWFWVGSHDEYERFFG